MEQKFSFLRTVFFLFVASQVVFSEPKIRGNENCISFANFVRHENFQLSGTRLKKLAMKTTLDCLWECNGESRCISLNVNTTSDSQGLFECDLLGFDKYEYFENFTAVDGIDHYTLPLEYFPDYQNCASVSKTEKNAASGVFRIKPSPSRSIHVYCDMVTSGGGWTVIQKRLDGSVDFFRDWADYKKGFGNKSGEYWLGLDAIHDMTSQGSYRLRFDLEDFDGNKTYAEYDSFIVAGESDKYTLTLNGNYSGDAGNSFMIQNNMQFTTKDRDNDKRLNANCAQAFHGAWWYASCHATNLNGLYLNGTNQRYGVGIIWWAFRGHYYSLKRSEMKIRPNDF